MKIFISEVDRQSARRIALKNIARFFNIQDWENKSNEDLEKILSEQKSRSAEAIFKLLEKYFKAYDEWFTFYQKRKKIEMKGGKEYNLSPREKSELAKLIQKREDALNTLQEKFDELQLSKFNKKNFGHNVSGIIKR